MLEQVKEAKIGSIVPIYKELDGEIDALEYFKKLSNYGNKKNSILMQSDEKSFGTATPCLRVAGKDSDFEILALNSIGRKFLSFIKKDFKFCDKAIYKKEKIYGTLTKDNKQVPQQEKLNQKTHLDILRAIAYKFKSTEKPFSPYCGLFGTISNDILAQNENLPDDALKDPDYALYFLDNMFIVDHKAQKTFFVANTIVTDNQKERAFNESSKTLSSYEKLIPKKAPKAKKPKKKELKLSYDMSKEEFLNLMRTLKNNVSDGNILYAEPSRTTITNYTAEPLDIYSELKNNSLGNTLCFINDGSGITISSGAESFLYVHNASIEFSIYANKIIRAKAGADYDNKYEALLKVDDAEISNNMMLLDEARDAVAKVSQTGTRFVDKMLVVNKLPQYQYVSSTIKGTLKENLDALHALRTTANSSGMPKIKSMQLLRSEKTRRSLNYCALIYISPDKDLYSMAIEPLRIKKDFAYVRKSSRVFNASDNEKELLASNEKAYKFLEAVKAAGGIK